VGSIGKGFERTPFYPSSGLLPIAALFALDGTGNANASSGPVREVLKLGQDSVTQVLTYNEQTGK